MTRKDVEAILTSKPHTNAYIRHHSRTVRPYNFTKGLYEMTDTKSDYSSIGTIKDAVDFLFFA